MCKFSFHVILYAQIDPSWLQVVISLVQTKKHFLLQTPVFPAPELCVCIFHTKYTVMTMLM